ncbi:hypothetical protein D3C73_1007690 [compost metagenome]
MQCVDITLGVIEIVSGLRIDPAHGTDHFGTEQDVVDIDDLEQEIDARLMIDAGIEKHVLHHMLAKRRALEHIRQPAVTSPVIRNSATTVRNYEAQIRKVLEQVTFKKLHERYSVGSDVISAGRVHGTIAATRHMDHCRYVEFNHFFKERIPGAVGQGRGAEMPT